MSGLDALVSVSLGIALAAAVGLRVFLPLLVTSVASYSGHLDLAPSFDWLATMPAMVMLAVATVAEVLAYYIPGVDHVLDAIAAPAAVAAGTLVAAAVITDVPPLVKWTTAIVAGGGAAGLTHGLSALFRAKSAVTTGGLGNPVVATGELGGSAALSLLALAAPIAAIALVLLFAWLVVRWTRRAFRRQPSDRVV